MTKEEIQAKIKAEHEILAKSDLGLPAGMDPFVFLRMISHVFGAAPVDQQQSLRALDVDGWIEAGFNSGVLARQRGGGIEVILPRAEEVDLDPIPRPVEVSEAPADSIYALQDAHPWLSFAEAQAVISARETAGEYARGLGTIVEKELFETWEGPELVEEGSPALRDATLSSIREEVEAGIIEGRTAQAVASRIAEKARDWARNWRRIAETELQAAHNEGRLIDGVRDFGKDAKVARVPESGACEYCLKLFLDGEGNPILFGVEEILENGTNVGRARADWKPTLYPIHPRCRCEVVPVPLGFNVDSSGRMVPAE